MANWCNCEISVHGSEEDYANIKRLIDEHTESGTDEEWTSFQGIVGKEIDPGIGCRWRMAEGGDGCVWMGTIKWEPPEEFVEVMSRRFPDATFEMKFTLEDVDGIEVYEFKDGDCRWSYDFDGTYEYAGPNATSVDHYRVAMEFDNDADEKRVTDALISEELLVDDGDNMISRRESGDILAWVADQFPGVACRINQWRPYRREDPDAEPLHQIGTLVIPLPVDEDDARHEWKEEGF